MQINRIKVVREEHQLLQKDVAKKLNMSISTYAMNEIGLDTITLNNLIIFCDTFNISLDYIFSLTNVKRYDDAKKSFSKDTLAKRLKEMRKEQKKTQNDIGKLLNIDHSVWCRYEQGKTLITTTFIYTFAKQYNISIDYLLGKINEPKYIK